MTKYDEQESPQQNPENTGLEIIYDNRSGEKLEIVLLVFNEERRIGNILNYYKNDFDIVLLDGGSTDRTIEMAVRGGASIYRRVGDSIGENHFTYYNNKITKSGYCFYMMADHFIEKSDLKKAFKHLQNKNTVIGVSQIEWFYGEEPKTKIMPNLGMARGFQRGSAVYDPNKLHDSLQYANNFDATRKIFVYKLHHLHIRSIKNEYGKIGRYLDIEIRQFLNQKATPYQYFRRFVVPILVCAFYRVWFNKTSFRSKFVKIMELVVSAQLAMMCWVEQKFMPTVEEQLAQYSLRYKSIEEMPDADKDRDTLSIANRNM